MSPIAVELNTYVGSPLQVRSQPPFAENRRHRRSLTPVEGCTLTAAIPAREPDISSQQRRSSVFFEAGLQGEDAIIDAKMRRNSRPKLQVRFSSAVNVVEPDLIPWIPEPPFHTEVYEPMPAYFPTLPRLLFLALVIALLVPSLGNAPMFKAGLSPVGAKAKSMNSYHGQHVELSTVHTRDIYEDVCMKPEYNVFI